MAKRFAKNLDILPEWIETPYHIQAAGGQVLVSHHHYKGCELEINNLQFSETLIPIQMHDFDVILGMDFLAKYHANIDFRQLQVNMKTPELGETIFQGNPKLKKAAQKLYLTAAQAFRALKKGREGFLVFSMGVEQEVRRSTKSR